MITPMIISFRECLEMLIVIIPLLIFLKKAGRVDLSKYVYWGCFSGAILSIVLGGILYWQAAELEGRAGAVFEGSIMFFLAALIIYNIIWLGKTRKDLSFMEHIDSKFKFDLTSSSLFILGLLTIFRESLEIVLFLLPSVTANQYYVAGGIITGILASLLLVYLFYKTGLKLNMGTIFAIMTVALIFIGGLMFGEGLVEFFPSLGESGQYSGMLIYILPLLYLYAKKEIKRYIKK